MNSDYSTYEEKLSAYLDGQLSPDEMAEMASAIEQNPKLADLLEKMRRLNELTEGVLPDFDDVLLAKLEQKIMNGLDGDEARNAVEIRYGEAETSTKKVFPIWSRYLSIAASIAVLFLVGRIAFKEVNKDLLSPPAPVMQAPLFDILRDSSAEEEGIGEKKTESSSPAAGGESQEEKDRSSKPEQSSVNPPVLESGRSSTPPEPVVLDEQYKSDPFQSPAETQAASMEGLLRKEGGEGGPPSKSKESVQYKSTSPSFDYGKNDMDLSPGPKDIKGKITDKGTGEPLAGVAVQVVGMDKGARTDLNGEYIIFDMPRGEYELKFSAIGYNSDSTGILLSQPGNTIIADASLDQSIEEIGTVIAARSELYQEDISDNMAAAEAETDTLPFAIMPLDSLKDLYAFNEPLTKADRNHYTRAHSGDSELMMKAKSILLLDSLAQLPGIDNDADRIESLYLKALVNYRMYLATDEYDHYREAVDARQKLDDLLTEQIEKHPHDRRLQEYADEIAGWQFIR